VVHLREQLERIVHRTTATSSMVEGYVQPLDTPGWVVLRTLEQGGAQRAGELADRGRMSRPSVSRCLTALQRAGLVSCTPDPDDGRAVLVDLTDRGRGTLRHVSETGSRRIAEVTTEFTAAEINTLATLLARFNDEADKVTVPPGRYLLEETPE